MGGEAEKLVENEDTAKEKLEEKPKEKLEEKLEEKQ